MSRPSLATEVRQQLSQLGELLRLSRRERLQKRFSDTAREHPDPTPVEVPLGYRAPPTLREQMQMYIREELSAKAAQAGLGTFEEENDFEPEDADEIPLSGYEVFEFEEDPSSDLSLAERAERAPGAGSAIPGGEAADEPAEPAETEPPPGTEGEQ